jgi:hypothetical protein
LSRLSADDRLEIAELYARYNLASDIGDPLEYAECFTIDGLLKAGALEVRGRQALGAYKRQDQSGRDGRLRRHWNTLPVLDLVGNDVVHGRCYLLAFNGTPRAPLELVDSGIYDDSICRIDGRWLFSTRTLHRD